MPNFSVDSTQTQCLQTRQRATALRKDKHIIKSRRRPATIVAALWGAATAGGSWGNVRRYLFYPDYTATDVGRPQKNKGRQKKKKWILNTQILKIWHFLVVLAIDRRMWLSNINTGTQKNKWWSKVFAQPWINTWVATEITNQTANGSDSCRLTSSVFCETVHECILVRIVRRILAIKWQCYKAFR